MKEILTDFGVALRNKLLTFKDNILHSIEKEIENTIHITTHICVKNKQTEIHLYFERLASHIKRTVIACISKSTDK
jgi:hypothetical protein